MADVILKTTNRTEFGKGAARRVRRDGQIPAVVYGHGTDPMHIILPGHDTMLALRQANVLLTLKFEDGEDQMALPKQVQRHPISGDIEHVDLILVRKGQKVSVEVPIYTIGEAEPGTLVSLDITELSINAGIRNIPAAIEVSVEGLEAGTQISAGEIELPEDVELDMDPETLVVNVTVAPTEADLEAAEDEDLEGEEGEEGAEGEESDEGEDE